MRSGKPGRTLFCFPPAQIVTAQRQAGYILWEKGDVFSIWSKRPRPNPPQPSTRTGRLLLEKM
ncbi:hypothetical protein C6I21_08650 [Alkalicoccus urumqiensis]|uniref:Uncharacterized protein n=1 Tax=Alkalicoccus urumqiensis TaxID=1548213 RepID=A0A2P6MH22_ALKUR|nr:hypothetical protein C6I21_08650 [Alkalicoccus urumqiensis]